MQIRSHLTDSEEIAFIDRQIELTEKKNASRSLKPTKAQTENAQLADLVLDFMNESNRYTITEIQKGIVEFQSLTNQKVTAIVRLLLKSGEVTRTEEKGKVYFSKK